MLKFILAVLCLTHLGCVKPASTSTSPDVLTYLKDKEPVISAVEHSAAMLRMKEYAESQGMFTPAVSCADYYVVHLEGDVDRADCGASSGPESRYIYAACSISLDAADPRNTANPCVPEKSIVSR